MADQKSVMLLKPQINLSFPTPGRMWLIFCCALLCVIQSGSSDGGHSFVVAGTSLVTAVALEFAFTWRSSGFGIIRNGSAAATALVFALLLPNQLHPLYAALGAAFAITVVKYSFGGLGSNWLNPALGGWLFVRFSWPDAFASALENSPMVSQAQVFASDAPTGLGAAVSSFLNKTIFSLTGAQLPGRYVDLLFLREPGIIADRGLFALLIGTVIITALGIGRSWVSLAFLAVFGFLARLAGEMPEGFWNGDILFALFSGGTVAAAFILAAEPATGAKTKPGNFAAVIAGAVLAWVFRFRSMEYCGCFFALALVNGIIPVIRLFERRFFSPAQGIGGLEQ